MRFEQVADLPEDLTPPSAVGNFGAAPNGLAVNLSWSAATDSESGIAAYRIYRDTAPGVDKNDFLVEIGNLTDTIDTPVVAQTTYYYRVSAVNGAGLEGPLSNEDSATTPASPPALKNTGPY